MKTTKKKTTDTSCNLLHMQKKTQTATSNHAKPANTSKLSPSSYITSIIKSLDHTPNSEKTGRSYLKVSKSTNLNNQLPSTITLPMNRHRFIILTAQYLNLAAVNHLHKGMT